MDRRTFNKGMLIVTGGLVLGGGMSFITQSEYSVNELLGKTKPTLYGDHYNLRKKASLAFEEMKKAASTEGINLYSASSFRSYEHQNRIWERKYNKYKAQGKTGMAIINEIIRYSTIPGTSRHHWGTDLDMIDLKQSTPSDPLYAPHFQKGGVYEKLGAWLLANAESFGFYETYTNDPVRKGFEYEPWHYSFGELAIPMLKEYLKIDLKAELLNSGLLGASDFTTEFITKYKKENILGINPVLLAGI